ncbi:MAG: NfeD family protein [Anaerolineales bacterium]|jgi:membrane-bound serine protease (ClpP class)
MDASLLANLIFLAMTATVWLTVMALITPGTGVLELLALVALGFSAFGILTLSINLWALPLLLAGTVLFGLSLWRWQRGLWLALSAIAFSVGSMFLFRIPGRILAVDPLLGAGTSLLTLIFFWLVVRKSLLAFRSPSSDSLSAVMGKVGEARTLLNPVGSVFVNGELWSARADTEIPPGTKIVVVGREGLILIVQPAQN